jgi:hypothetical protein
VVYRKNLEILAREALEYCNRTRMPTGMRIENTVLMRLQMEMFTLLRIGLEGVYVTFW